MLIARLQNQNEDGNDRERKLEAEKRGARQDSLVETGKPTGMVQVTFL